MICDRKLKCLEHFKINSYYVTITIDFVALLLELDVCCGTFEEDFSS